jgi:hypothetical protein
MFGFVKGIMSSRLVIPSGPTHINVSSLLYAETREGVRKGEWTILRNILLSFAILA